MMNISCPFHIYHNKIGVITSLTGSVIHDILRVLNRRFANIPLDVLPAKVQGEDAEKELIAAIRLLNQRHDADVAILARGGGSLEDLQAFNTEASCQRDLCIQDTHYFSHWS